MNAKTMMNGTDHSPCSRRLLLGFLLLLAGLFGSGTSLLASGGPGYTVTTSLPLGKPTALACDAEEKIYVAEASRNQVLVLDPAGRILHVLSGLAKPVSVAVDGSGRLYVGCQDSGEVRVFAADFSRLHSLGRGPGEFQLLTGVAVRPDGRAYVADAMSHEIRVYDSDGAPAFSFGGRGNEDGRFSYPVALAVHEASAEIVIADLQTAQMPSSPVPCRGARLQVFSPDGVFKRTFGQFGQGEGKLTMPIGLAVDGMGRILVSDGYQNVVQIFDRDGAYLEPVFSQESPLRQPLGLALGPVTGNLYIAGSGSGAVEVYGLPLQYAVDFTAGAGGRITPDGVQNARHGANLSFSVTPDPGYVISDVLLDGVSLGPLSSHTLTGVIADHEVLARFSRDRYALSATSGPHGAVTPQGVFQVEAGEDLRFLITPDPGYRIGTLLVDGQPAPPIGEYEFHNVAADHNLQADFVPLTHRITAASTGCGRLEPSGVIPAAIGDDLTFTMIPDPDCRLVAVLVDDIHQGPVSPLVLLDITGPRYVQAVFAPVSADEEAEKANLRVRVTGPGSIHVLPADHTCSKDCSFDLARGTAAVFRPRPFAASVFAAWLDGPGCEGLSEECSLTVNDSTTVQALFTAEDNLEDFRNGDFSRFPWESKGTAGWRIMSASGRRFAIPPPSLENGQTAGLEVTLELAAPGVIIFDFSFLRESGSVLSFLIDNRQMGQWRSDTAGPRPLFAVNGGRHRFRWEFIKNAGPDVSSSLVRLDRIIFPPSLNREISGPSLTINGEDGPVTVGSGTSFTLTPSFSMPTRNSQEGPAWGLLLQRDEAFFFFDPDMNRWKKVDPAQTLFAPLFSETPVEGRVRELIPAIYGALNNTVIQGQAAAAPMRTYNVSGDFLFSGLPPGDYTFYLGIAPTAGGRGDRTMRHDRVELHIAE